MKVTVRTLQQCKAEGRKFSSITAYDATFAHLASTAGIDVILIGDSLGMVLQGHDSTLPVTVEDMAYHTACVARGNQGSLIMADLPFLTAATTERALDASHKLMAAGDRKSTRLNSSHVAISYAVFCLKKKKNN